jgi:cyclopropane-fatty-acyl-phospholipid synthase
MHNISKNLMSMLADHDIHHYGSAELLKFENNMTRFFEREYKQWRGNDNPPEDYGISSFAGDIANSGTCIESIDHYNQDVNVYEAFLDREHMCYTMAYYGATDSSPEIDSKISLSEAQINKFNLVIERAGIKDGDSVLELGVTAINPCNTQSAYFRKTLMSVDSRDLSSRATLIEKFFDDITEHDLQDNSFDKVISIGVLEAVTNFDKLFRLISRVLKPGGKSLHHFIVSRDTIPKFLSAESTLMANYFPGGHIWPYAEAQRHTRHLEFENSWFINGMNYWKTLDEWHRRFWSSIEKLHPASLSIEDIKEWNSYFVLCKTMFNPDNGRSYGNGQFLFSKRE